MVVETEVALERVLELRPAREVATTELDAPMLVEDRALEPFDEAVGPGVSGLCAGVADAELGAGGGEAALELAASIGEYTLDGPAGFAEAGYQDLAEEASGRGGRRLRQDDDLAGSVEYADLPGQQPDLLVGLSERSLLHDR